MMSSRARAKLTVLSVLSALAAAPQLWAGETYEIDSTHSFISFAVKHLNVSMAHGRFNSFEGAIQYDPDTSSATSIELIIKADSIDTGNERRDKHLKSPDFFNAKQFGVVSFKSTAIEKTSPNSMRVMGDLTLLGVTKSVTVVVEEIGSGKGPRGSFLRGFQGTVQIKRSDFNMSYGIEAGALGDEVTLSFSLETVKKS